MLPIRSFVRVRGQDETYRPLTMQDLSVQTEKIMGSGAANDPYRLHVTVRNTSEEAWHGILKLDVFFHQKSPSFFCRDFYMAPIGVTHRWKRTAKRLGSERAPLLFPLLPGGSPAVTGFLIRRSLLSAETVLLESAQLRISLCREMKKAPGNPVSKGKCFNTQALAVILTAARSAIPWVMKTRLGFS